ncbi:MAG: hypothetical protein COV67_05900, partial [Nitrospinae bacterium CG11_big_fil_rev_8_21_14_0_20_56_8]
MRRVWSVSWTVIDHMFHKRNHVGTVLTILTLTIVGVLGISHHETVRGDGFPRTANYFLDWQIDTGDIPLLARYDLLILDMETQVTSRAALEELRLRNPDIKLLVYITPQEILAEAGSGSSVLRDRLFARIHPDWYLRSAAGTRLSWWPGSRLLNVTDGAPERGGMIWSDVLVDFVASELLGTGLWDGVFYDNAWDNITWFVGTDIDLNIDGKIDTHADQAWQGGMRDIYTRTRSLTHGRYPIVVNGLTNVYQDITNGQMLENFAVHAWPSIMRTYRDGRLANLIPEINIVNANTANQGSFFNFQDMRYGMTSALMEDGYFSFDFGDTDHGQTWWYDEYDVDLGVGTGGAESLSGGVDYAPGVWSRTFERGLAIVNSTYSAERVRLSGEFEKIHGKQDPAVNDGSIVREVDLGGRDGLILLKTFSRLDDVIFTNGYFTRFLSAEGDRVRNGTFLFDEDDLGEDQVIHTDLDGDGWRDKLRVRGPRVEAWRHDGQRLFLHFPYTANFREQISVAVGDLDGDGAKEIVVGPERGEGSLYVYSAEGEILRQRWYPFGKGHRLGMSLAIGNVDGGSRQEVIVSAGFGSEPIVQIYSLSPGYDFIRIAEWFAFERSHRRGVRVASANLRGNYLHEIAVSD